VLGAHAARAAPDVPVASAARLGGDLNRTRFVTDLSRAVGFSVYVLPDPFRVIIDMPEVNFQLPPGLGSRGHGLVSAYRYGLFANGKSRIVLDASQPVLIEKSFVLKPQDGQPARLVVDLVRTDHSTFMKIHNLVDPHANQGQREAAELSQAAREAARLALLPLPIANPRRGKVSPVAAWRTPRVPAPKPKRRKPVIVIDPGHGGVDPGAVGRRGTSEKSVVLALGLMLRARLEATGRYKVHMTRSTDRFVKLHDRVSFARRHNADLFIALHADAIARRRDTLRGATVYTLSERASDKEAAALAARENKADLIAGVNLASQNDEVTGILIELAQRATNKSSVALARTVVSKLGKATRLTRVPHRQAGFRVLKAPDIPSILLEIGYISHRRDEALLLSDGWRRKVSAALVSAIDAYFAARS